MCLAGPDGEGGIKPEPGTSTTEYVLDENK